ncbi:MAG: CBS domain-containing protein, partial [Pseudomonadales bacterium]|nr:CBS domain-containing protein [Pseudomonadales bacterium]
TVEDIMIPRNEVVGINLDDDINIILKTLGRSTFTRMPVYRGDINNMVGILHMRNVTRFMKNGELPTDTQCIIDNMRSPYFIPESTPLNVQLWNFQKEKRRIGIVVDEYGDVQGLITLEDLLEEIVGEFTTNISDISDDIYHQQDGSIIIDCSATIRDINKQLHWQLNTEGPKTLNGLITEHLGKIPSNNVCFSLGNYRFETTEIMDNRIKTVKAHEAQPSTTKIK